MLIAKMRPKTHRDPLFAIVISVIVASVLSVYPLSYETSMASIIYVNGHAILGIVSADLVRDLVCICHRDLH